MAISRTPVVTNLGSFVVVDTDVDENAQTNTTGANGKLHMLSIDNTGNAAVMYVKFWDSSSAITVGTDAPDYVFRADASTRHTLVFPEGLTFANGFTHACVNTGGTAGSGASAAPGSAVTIRYVTA
jgi:hypothetical protein